MQDFTLTTYKKLLHSLLINDYSFQTLENFIQHPNKEKIVILRHDVDRKPGNSLKTARLENELGIRATYFFRTIPQTFKPEIIKEIAEMGHEIGCHYEDVDLSSRGQRSEVGGQKKLDDSTVFDKAIKSFEINLSALRKLVPVKTICMHGSPLSKWDNRDLWKKYNYRDFGIIAEPYFDVDFDEVFYLTDTGRRWDGDKVSVRDKVERTEGRNQRSEVGGQRSEVRGIPPGSFYGVKRSGSGHKAQPFHRSTFDIIEAAERGLLPDKIMLNVHPQRWTDNTVEWAKELVYQNVKNVVKRIIIRRLHR